MKIETREFYQKIIFLDKRMELCQGEELFRLSTERQELVFRRCFSDDQASLVRYVQVFCENRTKVVCENLDTSKYMGMNREELRKELDAIGIKEIGVHEQICRDIAITWNWHIWNKRALSDEETMMAASCYSYDLHLRGDLYQYELAELRRESKRNYTNNRFAIAMAVVDCTESRRQTTGQPRLLKQVSPVGEYCLTRSVHPVPVSPGDAVPMSP